MKKLIVAGGTSVADIAAEEFDSSALVPFFKNNRKSKCATTATNADLLLFLSSEEVQGLIHPRCNCFEQRKREGRGGEIRQAIERRSRVKEVGKYREK